MRPTFLRGTALGALVLAAAFAGAGGAVAAYKLHFGWSPRPHFPEPLIAPAAKPNTWLFKTRLAPELEVRRGNWELRVNWEREDQQEWNFPRILQQMLRLGCEIVEPKRAQELIARLYATRSLAAPRGGQILHRLRVFDSGCVIFLEARGAKMHTLRVVVSPPPPPKPKPAPQPTAPKQ